MIVSRTRTPGNAKSESPLRDPILVDEVEAARLLGISRPTLRNWISSGLLKKVELPHGIRRNLLRVSDLEALADKLADGSTVRP